MSETAIHTATADPDQLYSSFLDFIRKDAQKERRQVNRKMLGVFFWCFLMPALFSISILVLVKIGFLPVRFRGYLDWLVLAFPVAYSMYFLSSEVLRELPAAFRRGGIANALRQSETDAKWRQGVCTELARTFRIRPDQWDWILRSFRADLESMQYRTRYLTALAGAVFFLLMQGIDSLTDSDQKVAWVKDQSLGWVELAGGSNLSQFVGLGLFLVLLYLSGYQNYQALRRYFDCAELARMHVQR